VGLAALGHVSTHAYPANHLTAQAACTCMLSGSTCGKQSAHSTSAVCTLHAAGLTGVLAAAAMMRHACTPPVANLGPLNPYVAAAFEEWGLGGGSGASGGSKHGLTAVVARQPAAAPPLTASLAAGE
jgi:hypothetical protein